MRVRGTWIGFLSVPMALMLYGACSTMQSSHEGHEGMEHDHTAMIPADSYFPSYFEARNPAQQDNRDDTVAQKKALEAAAPAANAPGPDSNLGQLDLCGGPKNYIDPKAIPDTVTMNLLLKDSGPGKSDGLGSRGHRMWHYMWHSTRNSWARFSPAQIKVIKKIGDGWVVPEQHYLEMPFSGATGPESSYDPTDPAGLDKADSKLPMTIRVLENGVPKDRKIEIDWNKNWNVAGEDFLFMHHVMYRYINGRILAENKRRADINAANPGGQKLPMLKCLRGWDTLPGQNENPKPPIPSGAGSSNRLATMRGWEKQFSNEDEFLRKNSLSALGAAVEESLHNNMHMRWAGNPDPSIGNRPQIPLNGILPTNWKWDDPKYNWLGDTYSSQMHPIFWKLHGLVDNFIFKWLRANGYEFISRDCAGRKGCYQWRGSWMGVGPFDPAQETDGAGGKKVRKIVALNSYWNTDEGKKEIPGALDLLDQGSFMVSGAGSDASFKALGDPTDFRSFVKNARKQASARGARTDNPKHLPPKAAVAQ